MHKRNIKSQRMWAIMSDDLTRWCNPQPAERPTCFVTIQRNPISRQLLSNKPIIAIVVIHAERHGRCPRQTHVLDHLGAIGFDLDAAKPALVALRPALAGAVIAVKSLVAENQCSQWTDAWRQEIHEFMDIYGLNWIGSIKFFNLIK